MALRIHTQIVVAVAEVAKCDDSIDDFETFEAVKIQGSLFS